MQINRKTLQCIKNDLHDLDLFKADFEGGGFRTLNVVPGIVPVLAIQADP